MSEHMSHGEFFEAAWPKELSPKIIAACVGGGITSDMITGTYRLIRAAVDLHGPNIDIRAVSTQKRHSGDIMIAAVLDHALNSIDRITAERDGLRAEIERVQKDARAYANVVLSEENDHLITERDGLRTALIEARAALATLDHMNGSESGLAVIRSGKPIKHIIDAALASTPVHE